MPKYNHDHEVPFEVYITNLGKYNEGELMGEWVKFPTSSEHIEEVFERIDIGSTDEFGQPYEEWFITDYDMYVDGMYNILGEYENLDELNYLASKIEDMTDYEYEQFCAIIDEGSYANNLQDLINITENLEAFEILPDVNNDYDLGYYYIEEAGIYDLSNMGNLSNYIDYERFGRDVALNEGGVFTDYGYVVNHESVVEVYDGNPKNIPEEYVVTISSSDNDLEKSYQIGDYRVDIQMNSDNDYDYTVYNKDGSELDGGVLINENGYDNIQSYVIEEISKMHDLEVNQLEPLYGYVYDANGMHGEPDLIEGSSENIANYIMTHKESPTVITTQEDEFVISSTVGGFLDRANSPSTRDEVLQEILPLQLEEKEIGEVKYIDLPEEAKVLDATELASKIDEWAKDFDLYEYKDAEIYPGSNYDQTLLSVRENEFEDIKNTLQESISEGDDKELADRATELLDEIDKFENTAVESLSEDVGLER